MTRTTRAWATPRLRAWASVAPAILVVGYTVVMLARLDVPVGHSLRYAGYLLLVILVPGRLVWMWLMERLARTREEPIFHTRLEDWACGAVAGYAIELVSYPVARWAGHPRWYLLVPGLIAALLGVRAWRRRGEDRRRDPLGAGLSWSLAALVGYLVTWLYVIVLSRFPLAPFRPSDPDEPFQLALIGELRHHFPPVYPYIEAGPLTYQWFVHAHMAASTWMTDLESVEIYRRFDVTVLSVLAVLGTAVVAMRVSRRAWPGWIAGALLVLVGSFDMTGSSPGEATPEERFLEGGLLLNSPTQTFAFAVAPAVVVLCLEFFSHRRPTAVLTFATAVGMALLMGAKVTFVPVLLTGFVLALVLAAWKRRSVVPGASAGAMLSLTVLVVSTRVLYAGDSHSLSLDPSASAGFFAEALGVMGGGFIGAVVLMTTLVVMWTAPSSAAVGLFSGCVRWDPRVWWLMGTIGGGIGAMLMLGHAGMSQLYFERSVAPMLAVVSAWGLSELFPQGTSRSRVSRAVVAAVLAGAALALTRSWTENWREVPAIGGAGIERSVLPVWVNLPVLLGLVVLTLLARLVVRDVTRGRIVLDLRMLVVFLVGLGLARSMAFTVGHYPRFDPENAGLRLDPSAVSAARWLRAHSRPDDRVLTNTHCISGSISDECDARHFWMSGLSERRFVLEGWSYTRFQEKWPAPFWGDPGFLRDNDRLFSDPNAERLARFLQRRPARWMLVDLGAPVRERALQGLPGIEKAYQSGAFAVYRVMPRN